MLNVIAAAFATVLVASPSVNVAEPFRVLAIGQSNMEGRYGPPAPPSETRQRLRAWNWSADEWRPAILGELPFRPMVRILTPANNLAYVFAGIVADRCQVDVDIVLLAAGGKRIEYFLPQSVLEANSWENAVDTHPFGKSLADEILGETGDSRQALEASGGSTFDVVIVHQGEANNQDILKDSEPYEQKLRALVQELRARDLVSAATPIIFGGINPQYVGAAAHQNVLERLAEEGFGVVVWEGVEDVRSVSGEGNFHATGHGLTQLGERYAKEYFRMIDRCPSKGVDCAYGNGGKASCFEN